MTKSNEHRVVSRNHGGTFTVWFTGTRADCRRWILGRARGHIPPYYAITTRTSGFDKCF